MKLNRSILYPLLVLLLAISSCDGQNTGDNGQETHVDPDPKENSLLKKAVGKEVKALDSSVWIVFQDSKDNYWFGSNGDGVFRYNGQKLVKFTREDGLVSGQIRTIQEDNSGNIFFDTPQGISKYDGNFFETLQAIPEAESEWKLTPDDLWFKQNQDKNEVYRYDRNQLHTLKLPEYDLETVMGIKEEGRFSPYGVYGIHKDKDGVLWLGTLAAGVYRYNGVNGMWVSERELGTLEDGRVPGTRSIIKDKEGHFWFSNILSRYRIEQKPPPHVGERRRRYVKLDGIQPQKGKPYMDLPYYVSAVVDDQNQDLWMASYDEGVWRYDGKELHHHPVKVEGSQVNIFSISKDNQGDLWLGTQNAGAMKWDGKEFVQFKLVVDPKD